MIYLSKKLIHYVLICVISLCSSVPFMMCQQYSANNDDFSPSVTARCDRGVMYISVVTLHPFHGAIHTRDHRRHPCLVMGTGGFNTTLRVSLLANENDELYCGVYKHKGEHSISLAVRAHKSLELSDDKYYFLTCAQSAYKNVRGGTYRVTIKIVDSNGQKVTRVVHGNQYVLRAELSPQDSITSLRVKNCFAFAADSDHVELIDSYGCPTQSSIISQFSYNSSNIADAPIHDMFRLPEGGKMHIQCDAILCRGGCQEPKCDSLPLKNRNLALDGYSQLSASTTVYVIEPDEEFSFENLEECTEWRFPWLITLCICLAVLLLLMLLLNLFMCSSLTCRCIRTEIVEREEAPEIEEYDPYRVDWTAPNSQYGSRMSLNKNAYNDSTLKSHRSHRSHHSAYNNDQYVPEQYSTLQPQQHSRPQSRYSTHSLKSQKSHKSQKSTHKPIEIDYSNYYPPYSSTR